MRIKNTLTSFLALAVSENAVAQGSENAIAAGVLSSFLSGFFILFAAVFFFSYTIKTIINQKKRQWTNRKILSSSLLIGFGTALLVIFLLYIILGQS